MRIGIMTGGGDCPGLNAVIRAVVRKGVSAYNDEFLGFLDSWDGVMEQRYIALQESDVRGLLPRGGTILGTRRGSPYDSSDGVDRVKKCFVDQRLDGLIVIGGQTATSSTNYAETWNPGQTGWQAFENHLSMSLSSHTGTRLPSGDLVVIGGEPPNAVDTTRVQRWVLASTTWCLAGELKTARKQHTATLLGDGRVLVVGGTSSGLPEKTAELWSPGTGKCDEPPGISMGW
jgi:hypothetical protein